MSKILELCNLTPKPKERVYQGRGRPVKWTPEAYEALKNELGLMLVWFQGVYNRKPFSDTEMIACYVAHLARQAGISDEKANAAKVAMISKTLRNRLPKAR
jgi:hypothetical protein